MAKINYKTALLGLSALATFANSAHGQDNEYQAAPEEPNTASHNASAFANAGIVPSTFELQDNGTMLFVKGNDGNVLLTSSLELSKTAGMVIVVKTNPKYADFLIGRAKEASALLEQSTWTPNDIPVTAEITDEVSAGGYTIYNYGYRYTNKNIGSDGVFQASELPHVLGDSVMHHSAAKEVFLENQKKAAVSDDETVAMTGQAPPLLASNNALEQ